MFRQILCPLDWSHVFTEAVSAAIRATSAKAGQNRFALPKSHIIALFFILFDNLQSFKPIDLAAHILCHSRLGKVVATLILDEIVITRLISIF